MRHRLALAVTLALLPAVSASAVLADPIDTRQARRLLFRDDRAEVVQIDVSGLSEQEVTVLTTVAQSQKYYAAVGFAPDGRHHGRTDGDGGELSPSRGRRAPLRWPAATNAATAGATA